MIVEEEIPLKDHTTFKIGGPVRLFITCESAEDVPQAVRRAREQGLATYPLGEGSNVLASDEPIEKAILKIAIPGIEYEEKEDLTFVTVGAGVSWDTLVTQTTEKGLWGLENLAGIPGTVGSAAVQNIGAYGAVFADCVTSVDAYDTTTDTFHTLDRESCAFGYRDSVFKRRSGELIVVRVTLALASIPQPSLDYRDIAEYFKDAPEPALCDIRDAVRSIRAKKFPDLRAYGTAGSFFLNPVLQESQAQLIAAKYPGMPLFPMPEGGVKVPIAWLLDYRHGVLDLRDLRVGQAFVWPAQTLVLTTSSGATARDVDALALEIARRLFEATGITAEREVRTLA
ncbi:MAG: UDP-N-acetylmuramate dehydrogenase [Patescibacteria group bacterium]